MISQIRKITGFTLTVTLINTLAYYVLLLITKSYYWISDDVLYYFVVFAIQSLIAGLFYSWLHKKAPEARLANICILLPVLYVSGYMLFAINKIYVCGWEYNSYLHILEKYAVSVTEWFLITGVIYLATMAWATFVFFKNNSPQHSKNPANIMGLKYGAVFGFVLISTFTSIFLMSISQFHYNNYYLFEGVDYFKWRHFALLAAYCLQFIGTGFFISWLFTKMQVKMVVGILLSITALVISGAIIDLADIAYLRYLLGAGSDLYQREKEVQIFYYLVAGLFQIAVWTAAIRIFFVAPKNTPTKRHIISTIVFYASIVISLYLLMLLLCIVTHTTMPGDGGVG